MRVYIDGVWDLFHAGHLECLRFAKNLYKDVTLVAGVVSDLDAASYKRTPIFSESDRTNIIQQIKYVDEVIFPAPLLVTNDFLDANKIDIVVHGFANDNDRQIQAPFFAAIGSRFQEIPYTGRVSTTKLLNHF
jgi:cytidyltransferase-like protein